MIAVAREQRPPENEAEIIGDVERRDHPERVLEPRLQIGRAELRGERPNRVRIARKARIRRHSVVFERDPIRPHIAEIGREDGDAARPRLLGRDDVIWPAVAVQDEIGDLMPIELRRDKGAPIIEMPAEIRRRQTPEELIAEMQVDPVDAMSARDQRPTEPIEKFEIGPCRNRKKGLRSFCAPLDIEFGGASVALHVYAGRRLTPGRRAASAGGRARSGRAGLPTPVEERLAHSETRDLPGVESGPGQERVAAAHRPDLDAAAGRALGPSAWKPEGVGDDEGVGLNWYAVAAEAERGEAPPAAHRVHQLAPVCPGAPSRAGPAIPLGSESSCCGVRKDETKARRRTGPQIRREHRSGQPGLYGRLKRIGVEDLGSRLGRSGDEGRRGSLQIDDWHR